MLDLLDIQINSKHIETDEEKHKIGEFLKKFSTLITLTVSLDDFFFHSLKEIIRFTPEEKEKVVHIFKQYAKKVKSDNAALGDSHAYYTISFENFKKFILD